jgi:hypothetical protein
VHNPKSPVVRAAEVSLRAQYYNYNYYHYYYSPVPYHNLCGAPDGSRWRVAAHATPHVVCVYVCLHVCQSAYIYTYFPSFPYLHKPQRENMSPKHTRWCNLPRRRTGAGWEEEARVGMRRPGKGRVIYVVYIRYIYNYGFQ